MKKNPGRKERRNLYFRAKRGEGKKRAKQNEFRARHPWLFQ